MSGLAPTTAAELASVPVFPLPTTVFFPGIVIPLHIFEPRYRRMVQDTMAGEQLLAIAMIVPGDEENERPSLSTIAGVGRIIHCEKLVGGRYNILVHGFARGELAEELPCPEGYRRFRVRLLPAPDERATSAARDELSRLERSVWSLLARSQTTDAQLAEVVRSTPDPVQLADILAATVIPDPNTQQEILAAADLRLRLAMVNDALAGVLATSGELPPEARAN